MNYLFIFLLISCLSVGITTYILALALFFRKKTQMEIYFLLFLTFFTLRMIVDFLLFYVVPLIPNHELFYYIFLLLGRIVLCGTFTFLVLFVHKMIDFAQSQRAQIIFIILVAGLTVFFILSFVLAHLRELPSEQALYEFSPIDFLFFILLIYPLGLWLFFSRRIKSMILYKITRNFVLGILCLYPIFIIEDLLGSITFELGITQMRLRFFPIYYLILYLMLLYHGFKNTLSSRKSTSGINSISPDFIARYNITDREIDILRLILEGLRNQKIAEELFISGATVRNHIHNIFEKTGATNRVELARLCSE